VGEPPRRAAVAACIAIEAIDELPAGGLRQQEQGMVAHLDEQASVDLVVAQMRVARPLVGDALRTAEPDRPAERRLAREDPMEAVQGSLIARRVVLERAHEAG